VTEFLPPQSAAAAELVPEAPDVGELFPALLSLPQPESVNATSAAPESVVPTALPMLLSFT
jgi:hypothetical protein